MQSNIGGGFNFSQFFSTDEEPVNFFSSKEDDWFLDTVKAANKKYKNTKNDGIFRVYGHGTVGYMMDVGETVATADQFDIQMNKKNNNWKNVKNMPHSTLILYVCLSATEINGEISIARKISQKHTNTTVIGFDGYVGYGYNVINKEGNIKNVSMDIKFPDNLGSVVFYKNGKEINRMPFSNFQLLKY